jgi:hypothetical protein
MLFFDGFLGLVLLGLWIFCLIDVITTPEEHCRNLPKVAWVLIVLLFFDVGSIVWLIAGRDWNRRAADLPYKGNRASGGVGGPAPRGPRRASNPDDDEEFQAQLRARVEEQRRRARDAQQDEDRPPTG